LKRNFRRIIPEETPYPPGKPKSAFTTCAKEKQAQSHTPHRILGFSRGSFLRCEKPIKQAEYI